MSRERDYIVTLDVFFMAGGGVKANSRKEAIEKVMEEVGGQYPEAELTVYEAYEDKVQSAPKSKSKERPENG